MKSRNKNFTPIAIHTFVLYAVFAIINPFLPILYAIKLEKIYLVGIFMGIHFASGLLGPFLFSFLYHKIGKIKFLTYLSLLGILVPAIGIYYSQSLPVLAILAFMLGAALSGIAVISDTYILSIWPHQMQIYSILRSLGTLGYLAAASLFSFSSLIDPNDIYTIVKYIALMLIPAMITVFFLKDNQAAEEKSTQVDEKLSLKQFLKHSSRLFFFILFVVFFNQIALNTTNSFLSLMAQEQYGIRNLSVFWLISGMAEIPAFLIGKKLIIRWKRHVCLKLVVIASVIRMLSVGLIDHPQVLYLSQILHFFSFGLLQITVIDYIRDKFRQKYRGTAMSVFQSTMALSRIMTSIVGGYLLKIIDYNQLFVLFGCLSAIGIFFTLSPLYKERRPFLRERRQHIGD